MPAREKLLAAAQRLHAYLLSRHYHRGLLRGPDAGVRFNLRGWRFLKSSFDFLRWHDDHVFIHVQGYWILSNWILFEATADARYLEHDGGFVYSKGDYGFLRDSRSYPRPMAMTLFHLLYGAGAGDGFTQL